jgi:hypothetical protein
MMRVEQGLRGVAAIAFVLALSACGGASTEGASNAGTGGSGGGGSGGSGGTGDSLAFSASSYTVAQAAGTLSLTVTRTGTATDAVTANYATSDGSGVAGTDYTSTDGTLQWGAGDSASKTITVAVSSAVPFSGTKTFTVVLSDPSPSADAQLGSPSTATVTISGSVPGSGGADPAAPTNVQLTNEGANSETLTWTAAGVGIAPIAHYNIYRNGEAYATTTGTTYTDKAATNATVPSFAKPATIYSYQVSAVDTSGNEGPLASQVTFWVYYNGTYFWGEGGTNDYSDVTANYKDTSGIPESGGYDISIASSPGGYYQPFSGGTASPEWAADIGAFKYMILDLKPTIANQKWRLNIISRLPQGDVFNNAPVELPGNYGPAPVVGVWGHYKVPLNPDLAVGTGSFVGSISGTTLTVSAVNAGMSVQTTAWLTGLGVTVPTSINAFGSGNGGTGTYTLSASSSVPAGTTINMQRTNMYKFSLTDDGNATNTYYIDNVGFTTF